ncbi:MAG: hypothetical protein V4489_05940 [Chlamydiota bacterium]
MIKKIVVFLFCATFLQAASLRLENDSVYPLRVTIQGADGTPLGELFLEPQETKNWSDVNTFAVRKKAPARSITPLIVHWYCKEGETFSISDKVSTGAFIRARDGAGSKSCSSSKKDNLKDNP